MVCFQVQKGVLEDRKKGFRYCIYIYLFTYIHIHVFLFEKSHWYLVQTGDRHEKAEFLLFLWVYIYIFIYFFKVLLKIHFKKKHFLICFIRMSETTDMESDVRKLLPPLPGGGD